MDNTFSNHIDLFGQGLLVFLVSSLRYLLFSGGAWLFFYVVFRNKFLTYRIQQKFPEKSKVLMEIAWSFSTFIFFGVVAALVGWAKQHGFTLIYTETNAYPIWWFWLSIIVMLLVHDTWFYWSHRFMHLKWVFPYVHRVHHLSTNPTPWASFSFHPIEAFLEVAIIPIIVFSFPVHPIAIIIFLLLMTIMNVIGHLGFEIFPKGFTQNKLFRFSNTSTHHNMHHRLVKCNYGLYFNFWDRIMGTNHAEYHNHFEEVVAQRKKEK
jgi:Delta7-sterol 5-desaturase